MSKKVNINNSKLLHILTMAYGCDMLWEEKVEDSISSRIVPLLTYCW